MATRVTLISLPIWLLLLWSASRLDSDVLPFAVGSAGLLFYAAQVVAAAEQAQSGFRGQVARIQDDVKRRLSQLDLSDLGMSKRYVETRLEEEVKRSQRYRLPLSLVVMRVGGEARADRASWEELTSEVVSTASRLLRTEDIFGQLDGPEFAIVLPHTPREQAEFVIRRLEAALSGRGPAFGTAQLSPALSSVEGLLAAARADLDGRDAPGPRAAGKRRAA